MLSFILNAFGIQSNICFEALFTTKGIILFFRPQQGRENLTKLFQGKDYNSDSQQIERDSGTKPIQRDVYMAKPLQQQDLGGQDSSTDDKDMQLKASRDVRWQNNCYVSFKHFHMKPI